MALAIIRNDSAIRLSNKNISQTHKNKKNTVILYALFTKDMSSEPLKIDIEKVVKEKAPKYAKKIPGFLFRYLERTIHQDEINYILKTYKDSTGVKFADDLLSYMNVHRITRWEPSTELRSFVSSDIFTAEKLNFSSTIFSCISNLWRRCFYRSTSTVPKPKNPVCKSIMLMNRTSRCSFSRQACALGCNTEK